VNLINLFRLTAVLSFLNIGFVERLDQGHLHTDKKENQIFFIYKEIQSGGVAKSYMTNGLLMYREIFTHFLIY
jgi:hypothetical protein